MNYSVSSPRHRCILLHGWDAQARSWHGPTPVVLRAGHRALGALRKVRGAFHVGTFRRSVDDLPKIGFHTAFYDREHAGIAIIDLEGPAAGAAALVVVVPEAQHRSELPQDFADEVTRLACLLGGSPARECGLLIHHHLEQALHSSEESAQVFSMELGKLDLDAAMVLSTYVAELASSMLDWMAAREARRNPVEAAIHSGPARAAAAVH